MSSAKFPKIGSFDWFEFFPFFLLDFLLIISKFLVDLVVKVLNHLQLDKFETKMLLVTTFTKMNQ